MYSRAPLRRRGLLSEALSHSVDASVSTNPRTEHWQQVGRFADMVHEVRAFNEQQIDHLPFTIYRFMKGNPSQSNSLG